MASLQAEFTLHLWKVCCYCVLSKWWKNELFLSNIECLYVAAERIFSSISGADLRKYHKIVWARLIMKAFNGINIIPLCGCNDKLIIILSLHLAHQRDTVRVREEMDKMKTKMGKIGLSRSRRITPNTLFHPDTFTITLLQMPLSPFPRPH